MDDKRTRNQDNCSGKPTGERDREPRRAVDGFLLPDALPVLLAAALIAGMPQALQTAASHADAPAVIQKDSNPTDQGDQAIEGIEEAHEPLITDDLRTKEVMYASAERTPR